MNYHFEMIAQNITKIVTLLMCYGKKLMEILMKNEQEPKRSYNKKVSNYHSSVIIQV